MFSLSLFLAQSGLLAARPADGTGDYRQSRFVRFEDSESDVDTVLLDIAKRIYGNIVAGHATHYIAKSALSALSILRAELAWSLWGVLL